MKQLFPLAGIEKGILFFFSFLLGSPLSGTYPREMKIRMQKRLVPKCA